VKGDFKIVREGKRPWALYDLSKNRTETINLASKNPEVVSNLEKIWDGRWGKKK
jgi:arylsulfatase